MVHRTSLHVLLPTCILVLATTAACAVSSGSPALAPAVAPEAASVDPVPAERVLGEWTGVYFVYPDAMELTLQLTYDGGTLGGEADFRPMFERRRALGTVEGRVRLTGTWDPDTRTFSLSPAEWIERPRTAGATAFHWEGVFDATRPALAGRLVTPRSTAEGTQVYFTLSRPDAARSIRDAMAVRAPSRSFLNGLLASGPDEETVRRWVGQFTDEFPDIDPYRREMGSLFGPGLNLYADERFLPFFGKTFDQMGAAERGAVAGALREADRTFSAFTRPLTSTGTQGMAQTMSAVLALRAISAWRNVQMKRAGALPATAASFRELDELAEVAESRLATLWPSEQRQVEETLDGHRSRVAGPAVLAASEAAVAGADGYAGARALAAWPTDHQRLLRYAPPTARDEATRRVHRRLDELLVPLIAEEAAELQRLGRGLVAVQRGNQWYESYRQRYGFASDRPPYGETLAQLTGMRGQHLAESHHAVVEFMEGLGQEDEVDEVVATLLVVPGDRGTPTGRAIVAAAETRKEAIADLRRRRITAALTGTIAVLTEAARRQADDEGDWIGVGGFGFVRDKAIEASLRALRPEAPETEIQTLRAIISGAVEQDLGSIWASMEQDRLLRQLRRDYPGLIWDPNAVDLVVSLANAYAER